MRTLRTLSASLACFLFASTAVAQPTPRPTLRPPTAAPPAPTLRSASPATLELAPGGSAEVVIEGERLDALTGARVHRRGAPVRGVSAQLAPTGDPASRAVAIAVDRRAAAATGLTLEVLVGRTAFRTPLTLAIVAPPPEEPPASASGGGGSFASKTIAPGAFEVRIAATTAAAFSAKTIAPGAFEVRIAQETAVEFTPKTIAPGAFEVRIADEPDGGGGT